MRNIISAIALLVLSGLPAFGQIIISTFAGTGSPVLGADGLPAIETSLNSPTGLVAGRGGDIYFIDSGNFTLRRVDFAGNISAGPGFGQLGSADGSAIAFGFNTDEFNSDEIYTASGSTIWRGPRFNQTRVAGGYVNGFDGDGPNASSRKLNNPTGMIVGANGDLYIADRDNHRVRKVTRSGVISTVAGNGTAVSSGDGGPATLAGVVSPTSVAFDFAGNLYVSESGNGKIRRVSPAGIISTFAGTGTLGFAGDGGPAVAAQLGAIQALAIDSTGNVFVADPDNRRVRRIAPSGVISTYAGNGSAGSGGDGGSATEAQLNQPVGLTIDTTGHLLISDKAEHRVRRVGPNPPSVFRSGTFAYQGIAATLSFKFSQPNGATQLGVVNALINTALDGAGACYIAYSQPQRVLYLVNDAGPDAGLSAPLVLGSAGQVSNSQCTISGPGSSAVVSGDTLTLRLSYSFKAPFAGNKAVYLAARSSQSQNSGWQLLGLVEVLSLAPPVFTYPTTVGPARNGSIFAFQDALSTTSLQTVWILTNSALDARNACYIGYYQPGNLLFLFPDKGDGAQASQMPLSGNGVLENSQCRVSALGSNSGTNANTLYLSLNISYKNSFRGGKGVWTAASNVTGAVSPWKIWSVALPAP